MTDYAKLDAPLAGALRSAAAGQVLSVFVHFDPQHADSLAGFGLGGGSVQDGIATASLTAEQVSALSEHPAVRLVRLSSPLRLLGGP